MKAKTDETPLLCEALELCDECLHGLYVEHAEICSDETDCEIVDVYRKLQAVCKRGRDAGFIL